MMIAPLCLARPTPHSAESRKRPKRPNCPRCGSRLLVAEHSRFSLAGRIDYVWACDDCGTEFETSIDVTHQAVARGERPVAGAVLSGSRLSSVAAL